MRLQRFSFAEVWQNRFFSVVGDKSLKDKNIRSKHRKRVPTSVFSPSRAAARRLKMACWEVSQTLGTERNGARRVLPAQNPHKQISLRKPLVQVAGMRPLRRSPLCSLHRRRNPRTTPDHEAVAQGDRRKIRRSSWEIEQSSPRRNERSGYTCTGMAVGIPSNGTVNILAHFA